MSKGEINIIAETGIKIRSYRKSTKMTLKELAKKTGVSITTLQRIETGKVSPSVVLLSNIAYHLKKPITSFFEEKGSRKLIHVKADDLTVIRSKKVLMKIISAMGTIDQDISVILGEAKKGQFVDPHINEGWEFTHLLKGNCLFYHGDSVVSLNQGDSAWYDGGIEHYVKALSPLKFVGIYIPKKK